MKNNDLEARINVNVEKMFRDYQTQIETQLEIKFQKMMNDHKKQTEVQNPPAERESKVEKKFEKILLDFTAKF